VRVYNKRVAVLEMICGASCLMTTFSLCLGHYSAGNIRLDVQENFTFPS